MRLESFKDNLSEFKFIDDATGREIVGVLWVCDVERKYGLLESYGFSLSVSVIPVTSVRFNFATKEIRVNEPPLIAASSGIVVRELHACRDCQQPDTCRRIDVCVAHHSAFGEAREP